jgi:DNA-binding response OmpR family regulator
MRIALLDHHSSQGDLISHWLTTRATELQRFVALDALLHTARKGEFDLMVVHWQPNLNFQTLSDTMDLRSPPIPLLLVVERAHLAALTELLNHQACDYVLKPLRRTDFEARVEVLKNRFHPIPVSESRYEFGPYAFDTRTEQLSINGHLIRMTQKEFRLALLFFRHLGRPLSRAFILESVWPENAEFSSRSIDTHVSRVRSKLALLPAHGFRLTPVYGYGYRLEQISA